MGFFARNALAGAALGVAPKVTDPDRNRDYQTYELERKARGAEGSSRRLLKQGFPEASQRALQDAAKFREMKQKYLRDE